MNELIKRDDAKRSLKVCWLSAGVSSFVAGYLSGNVDEFIYIDIDNQHPDSIRFIKECEKVIGKNVLILKSPYGSVQNVISTFRYVNGPSGAKCTEVLKKRVRKEWEYDHRDSKLTYVWGFDCSERKRAERIIESMPEYEHEFPLIEKGLSKEDAHGILDRLGIKRPKMYDMGYHNNNCIGCVKGGMGYWNKIRVDFPDVFDRMAKLERDIGHSCIKGVYLDELDPQKGRADKEIMPECGIYCYIYGGGLMGDDFQQEFPWEAK